MGLADVSPSQHKVDLAAVTGTVCMAKPPLQLVSFGIFFCPGNSPELGLSVRKLGCYSEREKWPEAPHRHSPGWPRWHTGGTRGRLGTHRQPDPGAWRTHSDGAMASRDTSSSPALRFSALES